MRIKIKSSRKRFPSWWIRRKVKVSTPVANEPTSAMISCSHFVHSCFQAAHRGHPKSTLGFRNSCVALLEKNLSRVVKQRREPVAENTPENRRAIPVPTTSCMSAPIMASSFKVSANSKLCLLSCPLIVEAVVFRVSTSRRRYHCEE